MILLASNGWQYDMVTSGFVLGTIIFVLFLWTAAQNFKSIKQIYKFKEKTDNIYYDKMSKHLIRSLEIIICVLWVAQLAFFIGALVTHEKFIHNEKSDYWNTTASAIAITHDVIFLLNAILILAYMGVAYYLNNSMIVVCDENNLIVSNGIVPKNMITVSRIIGKNNFFKITYRDADLKGNLKEVKLRYSKELEAFLIKNGFYEGEAHD